MKYKLLAAGILAFLSATTLSAQEQGGQDKSLYIKGNALFAPIGILNLGIEKQISPKYTLQGDVFISPWKSFGGHKLQFYSISAEGRYYFTEAFKHWYVGANVSVAAYNATKWSYWNDSTFENWNGEILKNSNLYQKGFSVMLGVTAGYQFQLSERWNLDIYGTIGTSQGFYKGYDKSTGKRYDSAEKFNKSGEIIPYRGGVMISYKLK
ncbi:MULTISPECIES: DUF3575 domain-containing protein [Chryseobacterium]|uniref:DUF3575 domain-containing protein n=1 Tax=Chryseobacterium cucumeris TaxID=1813611 RepID=A0ABX9X6G3_9FLAO|nr:MULTISPECIES: DUF3575 domain-containing protein [Chryseobacterium]KYH05660.1 hypothetical protein A1704_11230 [Chryseobacterium cucumeris]MDH5032223.1 DUF3575 domain-containing protein [Chryseobacterium cucumeris]QWT85885.1 DUF3575 domain-containing protein [Chryseobacterium sp. PCH239]ROH90491.1 DUF3575 domain-containing protein [Chryseobacterium cucumeris]